MKILMTGLDHKNSGITIREKFALSKEKIKNVITAYTDLPYVQAGVVVCTCNRTEIYISVKDRCSFDITEFLCRTLDLDAGKYSPYFIERDEKEAFFHLSRVAAGLDSQILGDDQIITQVREAIEISRDAGLADSYLETMFKTAIRTAKEIKSSIVLCRSQDASAPHKAVEKIRSLGPIARKKAVVIGNGRMGRLTAELLVREGAAVTVTLREYKNGNAQVQIPAGAQTVGYGKRYEVIENAQIVVSATTSPHFTLHYDDFASLKSMPEIIVDLAVPRDVDPSIGKLLGINLFTIDDLGEENTPLVQEKMLLADRVIEKNLQNYYKWREYKESIKK